MYWYTCEGEKKVPFSRNFEITDSYSIEINIFEFIRNRQDPTIFYGDLKISHENNQKLSFWQIIRAALHQLYRF